MERKSIIMQMFDGERGNMESMPVERSKEHIGRVDEEDKLLAALREKLAPEYFQMVDKLQLIIGRIDGDEARKYYEEGFRLGAQLIIDILKNDKK